MEVMWLVGEMTLLETGRLGNNWSLDVTIAIESYITKLYSKLLGMSVKLLFTVFSKH